MTDNRSGQSNAADSTARANTPLFREPALVSRGQRWFGPARVVMPPSTATTVAATCGVMAMLAAAVVSIQVPDRVRAYGVLLPEDGLLKVKVPRSGRVDYLPVANGDRVVEGQLVLRLSGAQRAPGQEPELTARIASLKRELQLLDEALERQDSLADARYRHNRDRLRLTEKRIQSAQAEAAAREEQAAIASRRADRLRRLVAANAIAADAIADSAAAVSSSTAAALAARQRVLALHDERLLIEQQLAQDRDMVTVLRLESGARRETLLRQIAAGELQSALEVTAPRAGIVSGLAVRAGEDVAAGDVVMTVYAPESRLEAQLFLSPDHAGMMSVGQRVELQLNAYPFQFFGTLGAVVTAISTVALPPDEIDAIVPLQGPVFVIRARMTRATIRGNQRSWPLPPGTSFKADLVRARWPLYRWLLRSVTGVDTGS